MTSLTSALRTYAHPATFLPNLKLPLLFVIGSLGWWIPVPEALSPPAWHLLSIFVAAVVGIILAPMPPGAISFLALCALTVTKTLTLSQALEGFSHGVVWLIILALVIARGFVKTGLGRRIALYFLTLCGKRSLGLGYGLLLTDLVLAPAIPSNTARSGGILLPILLGLLQSLGTRVSASSLQSLGAFLTLVVFHSAVVSSAMFVTAMAANPLIIQLASEAEIHIDWLTWALAALVPGVCSLALIPPVVQWIVRPNIQLGHEARQLAKSELASLGKMKAQEWWMLVTFILLVMLWMFGSFLHVDPTTAAMVGLGILLLTQVLSWKDLLKETVVWDTMFWFAALIVMATYLNSFGVMAWMSQIAETSLSGWSWPVVLGGVGLFYYYSHYLFASNTAHITSMFASLLALCLGAGAPGLLSALILAFISNLFGGLTHYGSGHAPLLFGTGYVNMRTWWKTGLVFSWIHLLVWLGLGGLWWRLLGFW